MGSREPPPAFATPLTGSLPPPSPALCLSLPILGLRRRLLCHTTLAPDTGWHLGTQVLGQSHALSPPLSSCPPSLAPSSPHPILSPSLIPVRLTLVALDCTGPRYPFISWGVPRGTILGRGGRMGGGGVSVHSPHPDLGGVRVWRGSGHALSSAGAAPCRGTGVRGVAVTPPDPSGCQGGYGRRWGSWGGVESNVPFASGKGAHEGPRLCPWGAGVQGGEGAAGGGGGARAAPCPSQPGAAIPWPWRRVPYRSRVPLGCPRGSGCREGVQGRSRPPP